MLFPALWYVGVHFMLDLLLFVFELILSSVVFLLLMFFLSLFLIKERVDQLLMPVAAQTFLTWLCVEFL